MARAKANPVPLLPVLLGGGAVAAFLAYKYFGKDATMRSKVAELLKGGGETKDKILLNFKGLMQKKPAAPVFRAPTLASVISGKAAPKTQPAASAAPSFDMANPLLVELEPSQSVLALPVVPGDAVRFIAKGQEGNIGPGGAWREMEWITLVSSNPSVIEKAKLMRKDIFVVRSKGMTTLSGTYNDVKVGKVVPVTVQISVA